MDSCFGHLLSEKQFFSEMFRSRLLLKSSQVRLPALFSSLGAPTILCAIVARSAMKRPARSESCSAGSAAKSKKEASSLEKTIVCRAFSWHSIDPEVVEKARSRFAGAKQNRLLTVAWEDVRWLDEGVYVPWKEPATYNAAYLWFRRVVGHLVPQQGNTKKWCVLAHAVEYDPSLWETARNALDGDDTGKLAHNFATGTLISAAASSAERPREASRHEKLDKEASSLEEVAAPSLAVVWRCLCPAFSVSTHSPSLVANGSSLVESCTSRSRTTAKWKAEAKQGVGRNPGIWTEEGVYCTWG